jgi:hypothetical protein
MNTLYTDLAAAGCVTDHHESDLYTQDTATARRIIAEHRTTGEDVFVTPFRNRLDGSPWLDLPFMYAPFWEARRRA